MIIIITITIIVITVITTIKITIAVTLTVHNIPFRTELGSTWAERAKQPNKYLVFVRTGSTKTP